MNSSDSQSGGNSDDGPKGEGFGDSSDTHPDTRPPEFFETTDLGGAIDEKAELFGSIELFEGLTPEEIREVVQVSEEIELEAGETLFEQGDPSRALFVIEHGNLQVCAASPVGEDIVLAELEGGTVVGEMSIIGGGQRSATVQALGPSRLMRLSREAFDTLRAQNRPAAYKIIVRLARTLGDRRRQTDERVREVFEDPGEHLDSFEEQVHEMLGHIKKA